MRLTPVHPPHDGRAPRGGHFRGLLAFAAGQRSFAAGLVLLVLLAAVGVANPAFVSLQNLRDLLVQAAPVVIVGSGMTLIILLGEIDISTGSLLGALAAIMGVLSSPEHLGLPVPAVVGLTLLAGASVGLINGLLVAIGRVPSIVATLGMLTILRGVTELTLDGNWIRDLPPRVRVLGTGTVIGIPICVVVAAFVAGAFIVLTKLSPLGIRVRSIGGNASGAALARINVARIKLLAFTLVGALTGLAALVCVPQLSVIDSGIGVGFELDVVTAVVIGGSSIQGGVGGVPGTVLAALLLASIRTALIFLKLGEEATFWERAIQGVLILAAVLADHATRAAADRQDARSAGAPA